MTDASCLWSDWVSGLVAGHRSSVPAVGRVNAPAGAAPNAATPDVATPRPATRQPAATTERTARMEFSSPLDNRDHRPTRSKAPALSPTDKNRTRIWLQKLGGAFGARPSVPPKPL